MALPLFCGDTFCKDKISESVPGLDFQGDKAAGYSSEPGGCMPLFVLFLFPRYVTARIGDVSLNIIVSFSGRRDGNCDMIAKYISAKDDLVLFMRETCLRPCTDCNYDCMPGQCKYYGDGIYSLF